MARANNKGKNEVEGLIGNVWEARNYAMSEGKKRTVKQTKKPKKLSDKLVRKG